MPSTVTEIENLEPFTAVYTTLWKMAEETPQIANHVKLGNMVRHDDPELRSRPKPKASSADLPELALGLAGIDLADWDVSSTESQIVRRYTWRIHSGDWRVQQIHYLQWTLWSALRGWREQLTALTWGASETHYVRGVRMLAAEEGESVPTNRGIDGWLALWDVQIHMRFKSSELLLEV